MPSLSEIPASPSGPPPARLSHAARSDVQRNRRALLQAARELLATRSDVPMYEVARHAGVGQATLYRHFPDRRALVAAIAEEAVQALEAEVAAVRPGPGALEAVLRLAGDRVARSGALIEVLEEEDKGSHRAPGSLFHQLMERVGALFAGPLEAAKKEGAVRQDLLVEDLFFVLGMVKGAMDAARPASPERTAVADRAIDLALYGLFARPSA